MTVQHRFTIDRIAVAEGIGGHWINDQTAIQAGAVADGFFFDGPPRQDGFQAIREPSVAFCISATLGDGQTAFGDATTVANAGFAGRPKPLRSAGRDGAAAGLQEHFEGRSFDGFRHATDALDAVDLGDLTVPVAYGMSQVLLSAAALAACKPMARILIDEFGLPEPRGTPGFAGSCGGEWRQNVDKAIVRRLAMFPQSAIQTREQVEALPEYVTWIRSRLHLARDVGYRPDLHFDFHSSLGRLLGNDQDRIVAYLADIVERAGEHLVFFEDPVLGRSCEEAIDRMSGLRATLRRAGIRCKLIADEWANGRRAYESFAAAGCVDAIQIKMPDNGSIVRSIEAIEACRSHGLLTYLGGSCNETDISVRASVHLGLANSVWRMFTKPGLGFDEGLMIMTNEMARARSALNIAAPAS